MLGGAGFIGVAVTRELLKQQLPVRVFARHRASLPPDLANNENLEWFAGDFQNQSDLNAALKGVASVTHLITTVVPASANNDPKYDVKSNILPSITLLDLMVANNVKKIVFVSSGGTVYGPSDQASISETSPTNPIVAYGVSKLAIEKYLLLYKHLHKLEPVILRVANAYGEGQPLNRSQGAVGIFLNQALSKRTIEIWGDGSVTRDYIYVGDIADAVASSIKYTGTETVFNIGMGQGTTLNQLICHIEQATEQTLDVQYHDSRPFDVQSNVLDITLAKQALRWSPKTSLADGIRQTLCGETTQS